MMRFVTLAAVVFMGCDATSAGPPAAAPQTPGPTWGDVGEQLPSRSPDPAAPTILPTEWSRPDCGAPLPSSGNVQLWLSARALNGSVLDTEPVPSWPDCLDTSRGAHQAIPSAQ